MSKFELFFVQITDRLYKNFNGQLGAFTFANGRSVVKLHRNDAIGLSHGFACDAIEDDGTVMFKVIPGQMPTTEDMAIAKKSAPVKVVAVAEKVDDQTLEQTKAASTGKYKLEELEAIADKNGLRGLRDEASQYGIKGKSIPDLIAKLLEL
ncbi:hypothetical protein [Shewanella glacialipiscicola]|uniref:hypothetical protein n=1 Tax=Shewanella glacialipiscicola TaxID=614069 RepID=UPI003D798400